MFIYYGLIWAWRGVWGLFVLAMSRVDWVTWKALDLSKFHHIYPVHFVWPLPWHTPCCFLKKTFTTNENLPMLASSAFVFAESGRHFDLRSQSSEPSTCLRQLLLHPQARVLQVVRKCHHKQWESNQETHPAIAARLPECHFRELRRSKHGYTKCALRQR